MPRVFSFLGEEIFAGLFFNAWDIQHIHANIIAGIFIMFWLKRTKMSNKSPLPSKHLKMNAKENARVYPLYTINAGAKNIPKLPSPMSQRRKKYPPSLIRTSPKYFALSRVSEYVRNIFRLSER